MLNLVYKEETGFDMSPKDVLLIGGQVAAAGFQPRLLTNRLDQPWPEDWDVVPLEHNWPGWWSLIEIFRFTGPNVLIGLDTLLTSPAWSCRSISWQWGRRTSSCSGPRRRS